jgi:hypothetical protein
MQFFHIYAQWQLVTGRNILARPTALRNTPAVAGRILLFACQRTAGSVSQSEAMTVSRGLKEFGHFSCLAERRLIERLIAHAIPGSSVAPRRGFVRLAKARCGPNFVAYATKFGQAHCAQFHENALVSRVFYLATKKPGQKFVAYATKIWTPLSRKRRPLLWGKDSTRRPIFRLQNVQTRAGDLAVARPSPSVSHARRRRRKRIILFTRRLFCYSHRSPTRDAGVPQRKPADTVPGSFRVSLALVPRPCE